MQGYKRSTAAAGQEEQVVSDFAATLRSMRGREGLTLSGLARRVNVSKSYIGLMETGLRLPHPDLVARIDECLQAGGSLITLAQTMRNRRLSLDDMKRRDVLIAIAAGAADGIELRPHAGQPEVDLLLARTARLRKLDDTLGGADTYPLYVREMRATRSVIVGCSYREETGKGLLAVLAEQAQLAGWSAFDAGWHDEAADLFGRSRRWGEAAHSSALVANALALDAYQMAFIGRPDPTMADASCSALAPDTPHPVKALVWERAAWTHAMAGHGDACARAMGSARFALAAPGSTPGPAWTTWIDDTELQIMTGRCEAALHQAVGAVQPLTTAMETFPDEFARDKSLYLLALARGHLNAGDVETAAEVTGQAAELAAGVRSARPAMHLARVMALLEPHATLPALTRLRQRLDHLRQLQLLRVDSRAHLA